MKIQFRDPRLIAAFSLAQTQLGIHEIPGIEDNPQILQYQRTTWYDQHGDDIAWCSSFVNWCVENAGLTGTGSPRAKSWLEWGRETLEPVQGDICILSRKGGGHVGFLVTGGRGDLVMLGGNQSNKVSMDTMENSRVLGFRTMYATFAGPSGNDLDTDGNS